MRLIFRAGAISRSTPRERWREIDRWRRMTERQMAENEAQIRVAMVEGWADDGMRYELTNPAVMVYP